MGFDYRKQPTRRYRNKAEIVMRLKRIYGFLNGQFSSNTFIVSAVTEEGEVLASVVVRDEAEGRAALGMDGDSDSRLHIYEEKYPSGVLLEYVPWSLTSVHRGLRNAIQTHYEKMGLST